MFAVILAYLVFVTVPAGSDLSSSGFQVSLLEENDGLGSHGFMAPVSDNYYTQGEAVRLRLQISPVSRLTGGIRQLIYSPNNVNTTDLAEFRGDQPYAGWLFLFAGLERQAGPWTFGGELDAGVIGPAAEGGAAQTAFHQFIRWAEKANGPPRPGGLGVYEVANAPGFDVVLSAEREFLRLTRENAAGKGFGIFKGSTPEFNLFSTSKVELGTVYGRGRFGAGFHAGFFGLPAPVPFEMFLTAQAELLGIAWDRLLQGRLLRGVQNETGLRNFSQAVNFGIKGRYRRLGFFTGQTIQKQDLVSLPPGVELWHRYGQLEISAFW